ncbi:MULTISPECIES: hypothetical protein [unclassified Streptomyces]|uniref:hypothetical protein n=1 Tax=unclassified Streptomyces TaxID=2593676 RepID=UPI00341FDAC6
MVLTLLVALVALAEAVAAARMWHEALAPRAQAKAAADAAKLLREAAGRRTGLPVGPGARREDRADVTGCGPWLGRPGGRYRGYPVRQLARRGPR